MGAICKLFFRCIVRILAHDCSKDMGRHSHWGKHIVPCFGPELACCGPKIHISPHHTNRLDFVRGVRLCAAARYRLVTSVRCFFGLDSPSAMPRHSRLPLQPTHTGGKAKVPWAVSAPSPSLRHFQPLGFHPHCCSSLPHFHSRASNASGACTSSRSARSALCHKSLSALTPRKPGPSCIDVTPHTAQA